MTELVDSRRRNVKLLAVALGYAAFGMLLLTQTAAAQGASVSHRAVMLGDSLSAGYGLTQDIGWVALPDRRFKERKSDYGVTNASISGNATADDHSYLSIVLAREKSSVAALELGGSDALRGLLLVFSEGDMRAMIEALQVAGAKVLLVGMCVPSNYGPGYSKHFFTMFGELAQQYKLPLVSFLLEGVAQRPGWLQGDHVHPIAATQPTMFDNVQPKLRPLLRAQVGR